MKTGKLLLKGRIKLLSPCLIGSGKDERTDMDLIRNSDGNPFIPATSFTGVLRHTIKIPLDRDKLKRFWGSESNDGGEFFQSAFYCNDLTLIENSPVSIRDGVAIDNKTGRAKEKAKFNFEVIERDALFDLSIEIDLFEGYEDFFKSMLATIVDALKNGRIRLGAKTTSGLGRITLEDYRIYEFNFKNKSHVLKWLKQDLSEPSQFEIQPLSIKDNNFYLRAYFTIKNSLIVRSYTGDPESPDATHLSSKGRPLLPGTSIKGAIRARAEKILLTLKDKNLADRAINDLFGFVEVETPKDRSKRKAPAYKDEENACRGRVIVDETLLPDYPSEVQTRIKIDRFTGGVMEGALLETMPLFSSKDEKEFMIEVTIHDCKDHEAGLMLLILKDLWTGDLPVGGEKAIGRGVLRGKRAEITYDGKVYTIDEDLKITPAEAIKDLENLVKSLNNYPGGM